MRPSKAFGARSKPRRPTRTNAGPPANKRKLPSLLIWKGFIIATDVIQPWATTALMNLNGYLHERSNFVSTKSGEDQHFNKSICKTTEIGYSNIYLISPPPILYIVSINN